MSSCSLVITAFTPCLVEERALVASVTLNLVSEALLDSAEGRRAQTSDLRDFSL